jgi:hemoglobin-like flavoprotein
MTIDYADIELFHKSLARATKSSDFYDIFYRNFIQSSTEVQTVFQGKDMKHIKKKLKMTLEMVADNTHSNAGMDMYFEMLGNIHYRIHIEPRLFDIWSEALIATAAHCDSQFNESIRQAWQRVVNDLINKMLHNAMA